MTTPSGFEGATGLAEKIQVLVRFPILMRVILPGVLMTTVVYPFTSLRSDFLSATLLDVWRQLPVLLVGLVFLFGALISASGDWIYEIYEGRILWPRWLFDRLQGWQASRVTTMRDAAEKAKKEKQNLQYSEIWSRLRVYPLDVKGVPYASHPTMLGNILAGYEGYPVTRYKMDSVFYWPRLWLAMEKEKKAEIDAMWSVADGFLYLSAVSFFGGMLWIAAGVIHTVSGLPLHLPFSMAGGSALGGLALVALGYGMYRLSLPSHRRNGEAFKAIFDLYRDKITAMTSLDPAEVAAWCETWSYLQYFLVHCGACGKYFSANEGQCTL